MKKFFLILLCLVLNGCVSANLEGNNFKKGVDYVRDGDLRIDPKEQDPKYISIIQKANQEAEKAVEENHGYQPGIMGYCHIFWREKKRILKEKYGLDWRSPAELNPEINFD